VEEYQIEQQNNTLEKFLFNEEKPEITLSKLPDLKPREL
jgi:hypothetical protein